MKPYLSDPEVTIYQGDCLDVLRELPDESVDAVITDPPYGISFMGKHWDRFDIEQRVGKRDVSKLGVRLTGSPDSADRKLIARTGSAFANPASQAGAYDFSPKGNRAFQAWCEQWGAECLRVLKPGGHVLSFGGTRTYHRLSAGLEDAGFEIRDCLAWLFGSGFPKSLDVSKAIDKAAGVEGEVLGIRSSYRPGSGTERDPENFQDRSDGTIRAPARPDAELWQGWGTALKPAFEPIVLARKPLIGTVAANVLEHGSGALNVDGCRIGDEERFLAGNDGVSPASVAPVNVTGYEGHVVVGRWPANVLLDEDAAAMLDEQSGELKSGKLGPVGTPKQNAVYGEFAQANIGSWEANTGGASRFFYVAKASRAERNAGLESFPSARSADEDYGTIQQPKLDRATPRENWTPHKTANVHPTVKPIALMRWLIRLVTPPGGLVLDPFLGSGTTGIAASLEGFRFIGIEREDDYLPIACARIRFWQEHGEDGLLLVAIRDRAGRIREEIAEAGQLDLLGEIPA